MGSNPTPCTPYRRHFKYDISELTKKILELLDEPKTSTEMQKEFKLEDRGKVRAKLSRLYKCGHVARSPFK